MKSRMVVFIVLVWGLVFFTPACQPTLTPTATVTRTATPTLTATTTRTLTPAPPTRTPTPVLDECTTTLEPGASGYDGSDLPPGSVICLQAGTYSCPTPGDVGAYDAVVELTNIVGTAAAPVIIRNKGGLVRIDATGHKRGISITKSEHFHITGSGDPSTEYGIEILGASRAGMQIHNGTRRYEIDHAHIHDLPDAGAGIRAVNQEWHVPAGWIQYHTHIHHCYIHDVATEAMYIGQGDSPVDLIGVWVHHNRLERLGYDGIQVRNAVNNVEVHHNYIYTAGQGRGDNVDQAGGGLLIGSDTAGEWHNNFVANARRGIQLLHPGEGVQIYNSVIVDSGQWDQEEGGIRWFGGGSADIYNNTIVNSYDFGIKSPGSGGTIHDNIVVGEDGGSTIESEAIVHNNLTGSVDEAGFVDPEGGDYHLRPGSPAVDAGSDMGFPEVDYDGVPRPQGGAADLGAYEFMEGP